jgi:hypothetical protein
LLAGANARQTNHNHGVVFLSEKPFLIKLAGRLWGHFVQPESRTPENVAVFLGLGRRRAHVAKSSQRVTSPGYLSTKG